MDRKRRSGILGNMPAFNPVPSYLGAFADAMQGANVGAQLNSLGAQQNQDNYRRFELEQQQAQQQAAMQQRQAAAARAAQMQAAQAEESRRRFNLTHGLAKRRLDMASNQGPKPTEMMRNYQFARSAGYKGTPMEFMQSRRPQTNINMAGETSYDKEMGKQLATEYRDLQQRAAKSRRSLNGLKLMSKALANPNVYTGFGGEFVTNIKKMGQAFGVNMKGVGDAELIGTITKEIAVGNKDKLPGPMSDADRNFLIDMAPGLSQSPDGNRLIIGAATLSKEYEMARAKAARNYAAQNNGRLDSGVYTKLSNLEAEYGKKFDALMDQMRSVAPAEPRSLGAGFPRARNPQTGEVLILRDGAWVPEK